MKIKFKYNPKVGFRCDQLPKMRPCESGFCDFVGQFGLFFNFHIPVGTEVVFTICENNPKKKGFKKIKLKDPILTSDSKKVFRFQFNSLCWGIFEDEMKILFPKNGIKTKEFWIKLD